MNRFFRWFGLPGSAVLSTLMSLLALVLLLIDPCWPRFWLFMGMGFSTLGDLALMDKSPFDRGDAQKTFVLGMGFFAVAHVLYIAGYALALAPLGLDAPNAGTLAGLGMLAATLLSLFVLLGRRSLPPPGLLIASLVYCCIIGANCAAILTYAVAVRGLGWLCGLGVVSFALSDYFIALDVLCGIKKPRRLVWWFYPIGQILLIAFFLW